jgi:hypothetical protein
MLLLLAVLTCCSFLLFFLVVLFLFNKCLFVGIDYVGRQVGFVRKKKKFMLVVKLALLERKKFSWKKNRVYFMLASLGHKNKFMLDVKFG